jgi:hypothetical protein
MQQPTAQLKGAHCCSLVDQYKSRCMHHPSLYRPRSSSHYWNGHGSGSCARGPDIVTLGSGHVRGLSMVSWGLDDHSGPEALRRQESRYRAFFYLCLRSEYFLVSYLVIFVHRHACKRRGGWCIGWSKKDTRCNVSLAGCSDHQQKDCIRKSLLCCLSAQQRAWSGFKFRQEIWTGKVCSDCQNV